MKGPASAETVLNSNKSRVTLLIGNQDGCDRPAIKTILGQRATFDLPNL